MTVSNPSNRPNSILFHFPFFFLSHTKIPQKASPTRSNTTRSSASSSADSGRLTMTVKSSTTAEARPGSSPVKQRAPPLKSATSLRDSLDEVEAPVPEGLVRCGICKRNFLEERIATHQVICQKNKVKKRKVYDASKKRVQVGFV